MTTAEFDQLISELDRAVADGRAPSSTMRLLREEPGSRYFRQHQGAQRRGTLAQLQAELDRCAPHNDAIAPLLEASLAIAKCASERSLRVQAWASRRRAS